MPVAPVPDAHALEIKLARALTDAVVPQELPFFDDLVAVRGKPSSKGKDHSLGFGVSAGDVVAITFVLIDLSKPIFRFVWDNAKDATGALIKDASETAKTLIEQKMGTWLDHKLNGPAPVVLSASQLEELITNVEREARALKLDSATLGRLDQTLRSAFVRQ
jgi:hypothetical protein